VTGFWAANWDQFKQHFVTFKGEINRIRSDARKERKTLQLEHAALDHYVAAIRSQHLDRLQESLADHSKGYLVLLEKDIDLLFAELHLILQDYEKLRGYVHDIAREVQRAEVTNDELAHDGHAKQQLHDALNKILQKIADAYVKFIQNLAGMESFTFSTVLQRAILDDDAQVQVEIGDLQKARQLATELKNRRNRERRAVNQLKNKTKDAADRLRVVHERLRDFSDSVDKELVQFAQVDQDVVRLLADAHKKLKAISSDDGIMPKLSEISVERAPSIRTLGSPVSQTGGGLPKERARELMRLAGELEEHFDHEVQKLIQESRIFVSRVEHDEM
jgi:hypothetical protein